MESITAGEAVTLEAGDAAYIPANVPGRCATRARSGP